MSDTLQKLKRLAAMSPRELAHRVREKSLAELERRTLRIGDQPLAEALPKDAATNVGPDFKAYLAGAPSRRFYCGAKESLRTFIHEHSPAWVDRTIQEAETLCRREFQILNFPPIQLGPQIDWHRDPITGKQWERYFWSDYRLENDPAGRDAKIILELNRHQHLPVLAKAYGLTGEERYAAEVVAQMTSWIEQNPLGLGINWHSSLEIGIRAISWLWTIFLIQSSVAFTETFAQRAGDSLFAQLEHVNRYTSAFSSPNTHLIGEAAALFIAGLVFRDRKRPAVWLKQGAAVLAEEAGKQVLDDGVYGELSSYYHSYALDFLLHSLVLAEQNAYSLPEHIPQIVCAMIQALMNLTHPNGTIPLLGDDDGGVALGIAKRTYRDSRPALCLGATLFRREDFKHQAGEFAEETLWLLGIHGWETYERLQSRPPEEKDCWLASGGYASQRSGWTADASHLIFDCGGLGMLNGGHAHADALSIVLFGGGRELLADPGTFVYNGAPEWRSYFRSTQAHNTVVVDRCDQTEMNGTFRWKKKIGTHAQHRSATKSGDLVRIDFVEAEHDGYASLPSGGVTHRRRVVNVGAKYWIVADDFRGSGNHNYDFYFHFGPEVDVRPVSHSSSGLVTWCEKAGFMLAVHASAPITSEEIRGESKPIAGWLSRGYGEKHPGTMLRTSMTASTPATALTLLAPGWTPPEVRELSIDRGSGIASAYQFDQFTDICVMPSGESKIEVGNFTMQGEFFWLRTEAGGLKQAMAIGARTLLFEGKDILEDALCAPSAGS